MTQSKYWSAPKDSQGFLLLCGFAYIAIGSGRFVTKLDVNIDANIDALGYCMHIDANRQLLIYHMPLCESSGRRKNNLGLSQTSKGMDCSVCMCIPLVPPLCRITKYQLLAQRCNYVWGWGYWWQKLAHSWECFWPCFKTIAQGRCRVSNTYCWMFTFDQVWRVFHLTWDSKVYHPPVYTCA